MSTSSRLFRCSRAKAVDDVRRPRRTARGDEPGPGRRRRHRFRARRPSARDRVGHSARGAPGAQRLSLFLEWDGFDLDGPNDAHLGLGYDLALTCVTTAKVDGATVGRLRSGRDAVAFPAEADDYLMARRVTGDPETRINAGYGVLLIMSGSGTLSWHDGTVAVAAGATFVVPWSAGDVRVGGNSLVALWAQPPSASTAFNV
jgi:hypothetical protein